MDTNRAPNWNHWRHIPEATLWELVALSLNIDPDKVRHQRDSWMAGSHLFEESDEFDKRLDILVRNLNHRPELKRIGAIASDPIDCTLAIAAFEQFSKSVDWELPKDFPRQASTKATTNGNSPDDRGHWPRGPYDTTLLRAARAVVDQFWIHWNPGAPAPSQAEVMKWLRENQHIGETEALSVDRVCRPDPIRNAAKRTPSKSAVPRR